MGLSSPGLKKRPRDDGSIAYYWVASSIAKDTAGYPQKTVRLTGSDDEILTHCRRLTAELREWLVKKGKGGPKAFTGTIGSLIEMYQVTPESSYHELRSNSRESYNESLKLINNAIGTRALANITGVDFKRWHANFRKPAASDQPERLRRAYKAIQTLRILMKFGVMMNYTQCFRLNTVLSEMEFPVPKARTVALTFDQVQAICDKAVEEGYPSVALAQALQFELTLRQIDVVGRWEKADDASNGGIYHHGYRWRDGLLWSHLNGDGVLRKTTSKTGQVAEHDTMAYPFLRSFIDAVPMEKRFGPMILSEATGRPYMHRKFAERWRDIADKVGIPKDIQNRDSRAGGVTEGSDAGADIEHLRHHANHSNASTTARYNRRTLDKTRHVAELRVSLRSAKNGSETGE